MGNELVITTMEVMVISLKGNRGTPGSIGGFLY